MLPFNRLIVQGREGLPLKSQSGTASNVSPRFWEAARRRGLWVRRQCLGRGVTVWLRNRGPFGAFRGTGWKICSKIIPDLMVLWKKKQPTNLVRLQNRAFDNEIKLGTVGSNLTNRSPRSQHRDSRDLFSMDNCFKWEGEQGAASNHVRQIILLSFFSLFWSQTNSMWAL